MEIKQSTCNYCSLACNLEFYVEDNMIKKILPKKDYPVNGKFTCLKGINLDKQCSRYGKDKLPVLKDKYGNKRAISWNEAFELFADKMRYIQNKYGVESAAYISTGQITTEELALLGLVGRIHMGINGDGNTRLCMASTVMAYKQSFGFDAPPYTLKDLETSDTLVFIGANPAIAHPVAWSRVKKNKSASIVVIDPRESETAQNADIWLDIIPKSDIYLLYTLANVLIENNWVDREYIDNYTVDFEGFSNHVKKYSLLSVEKITGISSERVLELAQLIHNGKRVSFWWTMGVNQGYQAVRTAQAIINIAVMTGNIGREGTGPNSLTGQCNAMGSRMFSNTTALYGGRNFDNPKHRRDTAEILGVDEEKIPKKPTIPYSEIINRIDRGEIKSLWVIATNPRHSWANNKEFENAVKKLDFFVVQDLYGDTDSSKICDLFLPSVPLTKKQGSIINTERRLSAVVPVIDMGKDEMSDYDIFLGIGRALGMKQELEKWKTPLDAFNTIKELSRGMPCDITGIDYEMLVNSKGIQWPFKSGDKLLQDERRLFEDNIYFTQNGRMKFIYENVMENPCPVDSKFPYILNTGRISVGQWHTQSRTREINSGNSSIVKAAYVILNVKLAETLGIEEGDNVIISSINGNNSKFKARLSSMIKENQLYAPLHYIETNVLSVSVFDTYSKEPSYKYIPVNLVGNLNTKRKPAVISIIAAGSNSGKTTLIEKLVKILKDRNYRVGVLKHGTHEFEIDKEGKDTYRFTRAGADNVIISNSSKMAIMKVLPQELDIEEVLRLFNDIDIVFIEGFRENKYPKIEVHRSKINDELLYQNSKRVDPEKYIGIASDEPLDMPIPVFNLNDACSIADFIENGYI